MRFTEESYQVLEAIVMKLGKKGRTKILGIGDAATNRAGLTIVRGRGYISCTDKEGNTFDFRNMRTHATGSGYSGALHEEGIKDGSTDFFEVAVASALYTAKTYAEA